MHSSFTSILYLCSQIAEQRDMDLKGKKFENFERLYETMYKEPFKYKKEEVLCLEEKIRDIVGSNPMRLSMNPEKRKEELLLLDQRKILLDWMFQETEKETVRMKKLNERLFTLTQQLRKKMADVCDILKSTPKDEFTDDYEVRSTLNFVFNEECSILPYKGDEAYGSDFPLMIALNNWLTGQEPLHYLELVCRYNDSKDDILNIDNLDDGVSWAHETAGKFEGLTICHTTAMFCRDFGYPIVDVLHINEFWSEVVVKHQHFATLDPNYRYQRD